MIFFFGITPVSKSIMFDKSIMGDVDPSIFELATLRSTATAIWMTISGSPVIFLWYDVLEVVLNKRRSLAEIK